jgi:putative PEP-CTERM system histidine kinase
VTELLTYAALVGAGVALLMAIIMLMKSIKKLANLSFAAGMLSLAFVQFAWFMASYTPAPLYWLRAAIVGEVIFAISLVVFSIIFSRALHMEALKRNRVVLVALAGLLIVCGFFAGSDHLFYAPESFFQTTVVFIGKAGYAFHLLFIFAMVYVLVNLENTLRASKGVARWRIKYLLIGVGAVSAFHLIFASHILLYRTVDPELVPVSAAVVILSAFVMLFSLMRNKIMDTDVAVSRYVVYNSATLVVVGLYLLGAGLLGEGIKHFAGELDQFIYKVFIFAAVTVLVVFFFSDKLRRRIKVLIDKHFYHQSYDYRAQWLKTTQKLAAINSIEELLRVILETARDTIGSKNATLWLYDKENRSYYLAENIGLTLADNLHITGEFSKVFRDADWIVNVSEPADGIAELDAFIETTPQLDELSASLIAPLSAGEEILGFIVLGERIVGKEYDYEDFDILKTIAKQGAASILNSKLAEELARSRELDAFNKVSSFIMHDLKNQVHTLSLVVGNAADNMDNPEFHRDAIGTVSNTIGKMKAMMAKLSSIPKELELNKRSVDPVTIIEESLDASKFNGGKSLNVVKEFSKLPSISADPAGVQNVIFNLLANAYDAIDSEGEIKVKASVEDGFLNISIADNGHGMSREFIDKSLFRPFKTTKKKGFGIGLCQCKAIIEAHDGRIEVKSKEGSGTEFSVFLPLTGQDREAIH